MTRQSEIDRVFHALSDPTRREILTRLTERSASVSELANPIDMSLAAVAKHIAILSDAGLVSKVRDGRTVVCRIDVRPLDEADRVIHTLKSFWDDRLDELEGYLQASDRRGETEDT